ncbi:hypothetical protein PMIN03_010562 [Paraphaeosphaeria minitans]
MLELSPSVAQSGIYSMENQAKFQKSIYGPGSSQTCGIETGIALYTGFKTSRRALNKVGVIADRPSSNEKRIRYSDESRIREYLDSFRTYLLESIPSPERVPFDDQDTIDHDVPRRLLVGYHANMGTAIYACVLPFGAYHRVEFSVKAMPGQASVGISHKEVVRHIILYPFNKTLPQGGRSISQADRTRLALLVKWYFIASGFTRMHSPKSLEAFCKQFHNALRYIEKQDRLSRDGFVRGGTDGRQLDESDIQAALLAATDLSSPSLTTGPGDAGSSPAAGET